MPARPRVFVTHSMQAFAEARDVLATLRERADCEIWTGTGSPSRDELVAGVRDCEGLLCLLTDRIDAEVIAAARRLRVISSCSVGVDHVDVPAASARGIRVGNTPGVLTETTAELAFALMLAASRRVAEADRFVRAGLWTPERRWQPGLLLGRDLFGSTLGVIGLGPIGQAVAKRARAFGMRVLGWSRSPRELPGVASVEFATLLAEADIVSLHVALAPETRGLLGAAEFARMKRGAILVNTARGGLVDEPALVAALTNGALSAAALDVYASEPLSAQSPLCRLDNVVLTPHIGSATTRTRRRMAELAVANLLAGLEGRPLPHGVNPEGNGPGSRGV